MSRPSLLFIAHAPSPNTVKLRDAAIELIQKESDVDLIVKTPFDASHHDALAADGVLIATTENIGAMAGATKDFFDRSYSQMLDISAGKPVAVYIRAGLDGTGTRLGINAIMTGLRWRLVADPLILKGDWQDHFIDQSAELGLTIAAGVEMGLF